MMPSRNRREACAARLQLCGSVSLVDGDRHGAERILARRGINRGLDWQAERDILNVRDDTHDTDGRLYAASVRHHRPRQVPAERTRLRRPGEKLFSDRGLTWEVPLRHGLVDDDDRLGSGRVLRGEEA